MTLLAKAHRHATDESDSEEPSGVWSLMPQEIVDSGEVPKENKKSWDRKFYGTMIRSVEGFKMTFVNWLITMRRAGKAQFLQAKSKVTGEGFYNPQLHITTNAGFIPTLVKILDNKHIHSWRNEYMVAQATSPNAVDFAALLIPELHDKLQVDLTAYGKSFRDPRPERN